VKEEFPVARISWRPAFRIIPSRFPPIGLFDRVANPADLGAVYELEALTNPRLRDEVGALQLVPLEDRISGPGTNTIMAAFTHLNPDGSRFTDGSFGVFYAACDLDTAIAETVHHAVIFMRRTKEAPQTLDRRVYRVDLEGDLHDIRGRHADLAAVYAPDDYSASQHLARTLRVAGSNGIVYSSVRRPTGECAAVYKPRLLANCIQERHLCYAWDGEKIAEVYGKRSDGV
jgi:hypothetical protein